MELNQTKVTELYSNEIGMSFLWDKTYEGHPYHNTINIIFNNTGLHFNKVELHIFLQDIETALKKPMNRCGDDTKNCKSMLLETPMSQLSFAMSFNDLIAVKDLIEGTLFDLNLSEIVKNTLL